MARKTRAELQAEHDAYLAKQLAEDQAAYPARLMVALEEATQKNNYELTVNNGFLTLRDRDSNRRVFMEFALQHNSHSQSELESLEYDLQEKAKERAEAERLSALRRAAFAKLSDEEKNALGLTDRNNW